MSNTKTGRILSTHRILKRNIDAEIILQNANHLIYLYNLMYYCHHMGRKLPEAM
jgi:hypothetical protein